MFQEQVVFIGCNSSSTVFKIPWKLIISNLIGKTLKDFPTSFTDLILQFHGIVKLLLIFNFTNSIHWKDTTHVLLSLREAVQFQHWLRVVCFAVLPHGE